MKQLLQPRRDDEHWLYARLRDWPDPDSTQRREFFCNLWQQYAPFAPKGFAEKLQIEFHQRWWEMYVAVCLLQLGFSPSTSKKDFGPDISLNFANDLVFIEAVAPKAGTASDRVPKPVENGSFDLPERECLLRLTQALTDKCKKFHEYIEKGVVTINDCCIIAVSASNLNQFGTILDSGCPAPLKVLAGAGPLAVTLGGNDSPYITSRRLIRRDSGSPINVALFDTPDFSIVAGVLYSPIDLWNAPPSAQDAITLFVNPRAHRPIPVAFLSRFEHWVTVRSTQNKQEWQRTPRITDDN